MVVYLNLSVHTVLHKFTDPHPPTPPPSTHTHKTGWTHWLPLIKTYCAVSAYTMKCPSSLLCAGGIDSVVRKYLWACFFFGGGGSESTSGTNPGENQAVYSLFNLSSALKTSFKRCPVAKKMTVIISQYIWQGCNGTTRTKQYLLYINITVAPKEIKNQITVLCCMLLQIQTLCRLGRQ